MSFAGEQARGRVETDPTRARQINFGPGVQIGEILFRTGRAVEGLHIGGELNQVARDKARRQS